MRLKSTKPNLILLSQLVHVIREVSGSSYVSRTTAEPEKTRKLVYNIRISQGSVA